MWDQRGSVTCLRSCSNLGPGQDFDPDMSHSEASFFSHSGEVWLVRGAYTSTPSASFLPYLLNFKVHFTFCGLQFLFNNSRILLKIEVEKVLKSDRKTVHRYIKSRLLREIHKSYSDYSYKYFLI